MESYEVPMSTSLDCEMRTSFFQQCVMCPLHCSNGTLSSPGPIRLESPKQTGLYGQIGHLKAQIENLKKFHQKEKDAMVQEMQGLETKHAMALEKTAELTSKNQWLENRIEFMTDVLSKGSQSQLANWKQRHGQDVDSSSRSIGKRMSPLHRSKSMELPSSSSSSTSSTVTYFNSRLRLPRGWSSTKNLNGSREDTMKTHGKMQSTSFEGITNPNISNGQMAPIQEIDEDLDWVKEREQLVFHNKKLELQVLQLVKQRRCLEIDLQEARDQFEFRILELELNSNNTTAVALKETIENNNSEALESEVESTKVDLISINLGTELDTNLRTFQEEKLKEIQLKVLEIVKNRSSVNVVDKTTLVQAVVLLDICHKVILENRIKSDNGGDQVSELHSLKLKLQKLEQENKDLVFQDSLETCLDFEVHELVEKMERLKLDTPTETDKLLTNIHLDMNCDKCHDKQHDSNTCSTIMSTKDQLIDRPIQNNSLAMELKELNYTNAILLKPFQTEVIDPWPENRNEIYDKLMEALSAKQLEMKNKETEYALKLEALKYDRDEVVGRLETRLSTVQQRELQCRKQLETMAAEKDKWREYCDGRIMELELEREGNIRQLTCVRKDLENACRQVVDLKSQIDFNSSSGSSSQVNPEVLQAKVDELKRHENRHRQRIRHLESRWEALRNQLTIASSESKGVPLDSCPNDETRSSDDEAEELLVRVSEAFGTESRLLQRITQLEKKEAAYRETLDEADRIVSEVEHSYQERMNEMEHCEQRLRQRIVQLEQSESHLRQALNCLSTKRDEVEDRLRDRLVETEQREAELKARLADTELTKNQTISVEKSQLEQRERDLHETIDRLTTQLVTANCGTNTTGIKLTKMNIFSLEEVDKMTAELQNLSGWEAGFHSLKEQLKGISGSILACSRCQTNVGPAIAHLDTQMKQLHEIVFGNQVNSVDFQLMAGHSNHSTDTSSVQRGTLGTNLIDQRSVNLKENLQNTNESKRNLVAICSQSTDGTVDVEQINDNYQVGRKTDDFQMEVINELRSKVDWLETQLSQREREMWTVDQEVSMMHARMKEQNREYEEKCSEMSSLAQQMSRMHEENEELRRKLWKTEVAHKVSADKSLKKISDLEAKAATLAKQLRSLENIHKERELMQETLNNVEVELKKKREVEQRLCAENLHLHHKVEGLRERVSSLQLLKRDHKSLLTKHLALEKKLAAAELALSPLNNQISGLRQDCWDKERVIDHLSAEIRKVQMLNADNASFIIEHRKLVSQSSSQSSDDSGIKDCTGILSNGRDSEMSEDSVLTDISSHSDDLAPTLRISSPVGSSASSSLSSEANEFPKSSKPDISKHYIDNDNAAPGKSKTASTHKSRIPRFTAMKSPTSSETGSIKDSISRTSSQSSLQSCSGGRNVRSEQRRPTSKITSGHNRRSRYNSSSSSDGSCSADKISGESAPKINFKSVSIDKSMKSFTKINVDHLPPSVPTKPATVLSKGIPEAPTNLLVTRKVGHDGLLVAWNIPSMDPSGCSNGVTVSGYQILINNQLHQKVRSAHRTKALLNNLDFAKMLPMEISIQTSSITGQQSAAVCARYNGDEDLPPPKIPLSKIVWTEAAASFRSQTSGSIEKNLTPPSNYSPLSRLVEV